MGTKTYAVTIKKDVETDVTLDIEYPFYTKTSDCAFYKFTEKNLVSVFYAPNIDVYKIEAKKRSVHFDPWMLESDCTESEFNEMYTKTLNALSYVE